MKMETTDHTSWNLLTWKRSRKASPRRTVDIKHLQTTLLSKQLLSVWYHSKLLTRKISSYHEVVEVGKYQMPRPNNVSKNGKPF